MDAKIEHYKMEVFRLMDFLYKKGLKANKIFPKAAKEDCRYVPIADGYSIRTLSEKKFPPITYRLEGNNIQVDITNSNGKLIYYSEWEGDLVNVNAEETLKILNKLLKSKDKYVTYET